MIGTAWSFPHLSRRRLWRRRYRRLQINDEKEGFGGPSTRLRHHAREVVLSKNWVAIPVDQCWIRIQHLDARGGILLGLTRRKTNPFYTVSAQYADMLFKAEARRNKLLGLWAAGLLGKSGDDAAQYAKEVVKSDFEEAGHEDVYRKVSGDLGDKADEATIRTQMASLMADAKAQIFDEESGLRKDIEIEYKGEGVLEEADIERKSAYLKQVIIA